MLVDFYHLTASPIERVLPQIAERVLATGERLLIVARDEGQRVQLDTVLWTYSAESFLPHGLAGGEADDRQPVLIAAECEAPANGARNVALADGEWRESALAFDRAFHLFDESRIGEARIAWKALAGAVGVERRYWKQDESGRWGQAA